MPGSPEISTILPVARLRLLPEPHQQPYLLVAADQRRGRGAQRLEAAFDRAGPQRRPGPHRFGDALELLRPEVPKLKQIADKLSRIISYDYGVRLRNALQARSQIWCLANDCLLLSSAQPNQIAYHDQASSRADTDLQRLRTTQLADRFNDRQPSSDRALCVILVRLRVPEVDQLAVTHVFGDETAKPAHRRGNAFLVR
jgi:hypothetical protein